MRLNPIKIGKFTAPCNVFLAPLAGYTNAVFRDICCRLGAGLTFTEMVSAKGLCYGSKKTAELLYITEDYPGLKACQIFGADPSCMRRACESRELEPFGIVDINMGCPMPKIYKNGEGSALAENIGLAEKIISECKKSGKTITVKMRIGREGSDYVTEDFVKMCEAAGADLITVHGRTRDKIYSGPVNLKEIEKAKKSVNIPVIANGGIFDAAAANMIMKQTGADGVMIARAAMYNPWIFAEITGADAGDKQKTVLWQIEKTREIYGERFACVYMRKMVGFYMKGKKGAAAMRSKLLGCKTTAEVEEAVKTINFDDPDSKQ